MQPGEEGDLFLLLTAKETLTTRDGKPYFRVSFRDANREVSFPLWNDSCWTADCRDAWVPGNFYKVRAIYQDTPYGPQLEITKIREVIERDKADGFDPDMCLEHSRFDPDSMFAELVSIAEQHIEQPELSHFVVGLLKQYRDPILRFPSAKKMHHAFIGGYLEHVLSVTRSCVYLANKYDDYYNYLKPRLDKDLVVAGAILHDIGKLRELESRPEGTLYTVAGELIGHILQGRDIVRETAAQQELSADTLLRLEHIIVSHQRLAEWGSPKPPMTPEALIVHYADDLDAKFHMMAQILVNDTSSPMTSRANPLGLRVYRGGREAPA